VYEADFAAFGYEDAVPSKLHPGDEYPAEALQEVRRLIERAERIGDLVLWSKELKDVLEAREHELGQLRPEVRALGDEVKRLRRDVERLREIADRRPSLRAKRRVVRTLQRLHLYPAKGMRRTRLMSPTRTADR
jgi:hypothetical protein